MAGTLAFNASAGVVRSDALTEPMLLGAEYDIYSVIAREIYVPLNQTT